MTLKDLGMKARNEFSIKYRRAHFDKFRYFPCASEVVFESDVYDDEKANHIYIMTTPPSAYYGEHWASLPVAQKEEALDDYDASFEFNDAEFTEIWFSRLEIGRWKTLSESAPRFPAFGIFHN